MIKTALSLVMCVALLATSQISGAQNKKAQLEEKKASTQAMIDNLQSLRSDIKAYVTQLDSDMSKLNGELDDLNSQLADMENDIGALQVKIDSAQVEIDEMQVVSDKQYSDMKIRIKYMYERGDTSFFDMLFGSRSITDFLSKSEYVNKISRYDREQMDEYENTIKELGVKKQELETEKQELEDSKARIEAVRDETEKKQTSIENLLKEKQSELDSFNSRISENKDKLAEYNKAIKEQEDEIKRIEAELKRKEEERRRQAEAEGRKYSTTDLKNIHFIWPCPSSSRITSYFGGREAPTAGASTDHKGIDIGSPTGNDIIAAADGEVAIAQYSSSAGNYVMIDHGGSVSTVYMHASKLCVSVGEKVKQGQVIAKVGSTGYSTGPHLHFGIRANGDYVNPLNYVSP